MPAAQVRTWGREKNGYVNRFNQSAVDKMLRPNYLFQRKLIKAFHEAGVPLLAGTDTTIETVIAGLAMHEELKEMVTAGTRIAARARNETTRRLT